MTRRGLLVLLPIICALVQGCVSVPPAQPRISCAVWESVPRNRVFDSCVKALHLQGYTMQATDSTLGVIDSSRGIIGTDWVHFREGAVSARYRFNFLVSEDSPGSGSVSVNVTGEWAADPGYSIHGVLEESWNVYLGNKIASNLKDIFAEIEQLIGTPPATTGHATTVWK